MNDNPLTQAGTMLYDWNRDTLGWIIVTGDMQASWQVEFADGFVRHASWYEVYRWIQDYLKLEQGGSRRLHI
jgi:hypothetical protein